jgi:thiol:disulfide interchange protein
VLNNSSYWTAICIYVGSAAVLIAYVGWWLSRHWRPSWVALVMLLMAALLLTPAYPKAGVQTMAPALIVVAFNIMTTGVQSAAHALRPLVFMSGGAIIVALLLGMTVLRKPKLHMTRKSRPTPHANPRAKPGAGPDAMRR